MLPRISRLSRLSLLSPKMLRVLSLLFILIEAARAQSGSGAKCTTDSDCVIFNKKIKGWQPSVLQPVGFLCIKGECQPVGTAGEVCSKSSDCAVYQFVQNEISKDRSPSSFLPAKYANNVTAYLDSLCAPEFCTIASNCDQTIDVFSLSDQPRLPHNPGNITCCAGGEEHLQCNQLGGFLDTCDHRYKCTLFDGKEEHQVASDSGLPMKITDMQYCEDRSSGKEGQWIGIVMALLGSTLLNVGLNVQKLALRKRHEKKRESDRMQILVTLQTIRNKILAQRAEAAANGTRARTSSRKSFLGLWQGGDKTSKESISTNIEMSNLTNKPDSDGGSMTIIGAESLTRTARPSSRIQSWFSVFGKESQTHSSVTISEQLPEQAPPSTTHTHSMSNGNGADATSPSSQLAPLTGNGWRRGSTSQTATKPPRVDADLQSIEFPEAPADAIQFEKNLALGHLLLNPVWLFGFTMFTIANFMSFIALKFAPQSLVAPLGAWALVVNVILAPLINRESWGLKDIIGVVFIVAGSAMVVVFAGVSGKDYNLCVLLRLFGRPSTIIFLTVTGILIIFIFFVLCTIEKNLDLLDEVDIESDHEAEEVDLTLPTEAEMAERIREDSRRRRSEDARSLRSQHNARELVRQALASSSQHDRLVNNQYLPQSMPMGSPIAMIEENSLYERRHSEPNYDSISFSDPTTSDPSTSHANLHRERLGDSQELPEEIMSEHYVHIPRSESPSGIAVSTSSSPTASLSAEELFDRNSLPPEIVEGWTPVRSQALVLPIMQAPIVATGSHRVYNASGLPLTSIPEGPLAEYFSQTEGVASLPGSRPPSRPMRMRSVAIALRAEHNLPIADQKTRTQRFFRGLWKLLPFRLRRFLKEVKDFFHRKAYVPTLKKKIPLDSAAVLYILPLSYASLGGLMATITVLFAKSTIHLLSESLFENSNQYQNIYSWIITLVTIATAVSQIYWINMGLQRYDALLQIPIFYVVWTVFDVIGGGIYFDEFSEFTPMQYFLFSLGVSVIFIGVGILATRLKSIEQSNTAPEPVIASPEMTHVTDMERDTSIRRPENVRRRH